MKRYKATPGKEFYRVQPCKGCLSQTLQPDSLQPFDFVDRWFKVVSGVRFAPQCTLPCDFTIVSPQLALPLGYGFIPFGKHRDGQP
ncbi:MAG: hypothetical protein LIP08_00020 [Bacteroides sp.]|nr:hypothetical protein [Bacteroides sp.]